MITRTVLWGGPHDGLPVKVDGAPPIWHEAVPLTASEAEVLRQSPPTVLPAVRVAEYRLSTDRGRYEYVRQVWL